MRPPSTTARFLFNAGERTVARDQILNAMAEFDEKKLRDRPRIGNSRKGWSVEENGQRYNPKWILKLATGIGLVKFAHKQARETLSALGFKLEFDSNWQIKRVEDHAQLNNDDEVEEDADAEELTFDLERDLKRALRVNIERLEAKLKITDGGKEQKVEYPGEEHEWGLIDITAEDGNGATVVIELKAGRAGRRAVGQILGYMGALGNREKPIRGILVADEFSPQARAAARVIPNLELRKYSFKFAFEIPGPVQ